MKTKGSFWNIILLSLIIQERKQVFFFGCNIIFLFITPLYVVSLYAQYTYFGQANIYKYTSDYKRNYGNINIMRCLSWYYNFTVFPSTLSFCLIIAIFSARQTCNASFFMRVFQIKTAHIINLTTHKYDFMSP